MTDTNNTRIKTGPLTECWINERGHIVIAENGFSSEFIPANDIMQQFTANIIRSFIERSR